MKLVARGVTLQWPRRPLIMGIVNLGADSFSGDGLVDLEQALERARELAGEGAEIIDIGAESARTNRGPIPAEEEEARLVQFIERWKEPALLSINTWRPAVARAALAAGGHLLNDLGALPDGQNARICAETGAALLIMHSVGQPKVPHTHVVYPDIMARLDEFFAEKIALAEAAGLAREALVLDPGIDFAKQCADNLRIYRELHRLTKFERPILLPVSRKTVIGEVLGIAAPAQRDAGTVACIVQGMLRGAAIFRVHNVRAAVQTVRMIEAVQDQSEKLDVRP
ncbi:MAG: dihydropteroate synthase [Chthoniobacter sp.]|jgi:dihydropteroate synthase|nr:dihydropteroate synthase [Chthoniobacter sp.]